MGEEFNSLGSIKVIAESVINTLLLIIKAFVKFIVLIIPLLVSSLNVALSENCLNVLEKF
jgi:hypothetical protein